MHDPIQAHIRLAAIDWLRPYQREAVARLIESPTGILKSPTASGKTRVAAAICESLGGSWLYLVHRRSLAEQTSTEFARLLPHLNTAPLAGGRSASAQIVAATWQTVDRRFIASPPGGLILDEVQVAPAPRIHALLTQLAERVPLRYGLSATPSRGLELDAITSKIFGTRLVEVPAEPLVEIQSISRPRIRFAVGPDASAGRGLEWLELYRQFIVRSEERNALLLELAQESQTPGLVLVQLVEHARVLHRDFERAGLRVGLVFGDTPGDERRLLVAGARADELDWLVASPVLDTGVDVPELRTVINAGGRKSPIEAIQKLGRGMRLAPGKTSFDYWDVADRGHPLLAGHARARMRAYQEAGFDVEGAEKLEREARPLIEVASFGGPSPREAVEQIKSAFAPIDRAITNAIVWGGIVLAVGGMVFAAVNACVDALR